MKKRSLSNKIYELILISLMSRTGGHCFNCNTQILYGIRLHAKAFGGITL